MKEYQLITNSTEYEITKSTYQALRAQLLTPNGNEFIYFTGSDGNEHLVKRSAIQELEKWSE